MSKKFVIPFLNGKSLTIAKDHNKQPVLYDKEVVEEVIRPVRDLIAANDKRRA
jgi:hypothetical protein